MILAARLILAAVFAVAGFAKLRDREGSREAARGFGAPAFVGTLLPFAEIAVAGLLLPKATAAAGAIAAAALLALFVAGIARAMARGEAPDCHCFGALHSEPAGARTLARNVALLGIAAVPIAAGPGPSAVGWIGDLHGTALALAIVSAVAGAALVAQSAFLLALLRQNGRILQRLDALEDDEVPPAWDDAGAGLPIGVQAPAFELPGLDGVPVTLEQLRAPGRPVLLVFTDPDCVPCSALMPLLGAWQREHAESLTVALVSRGSAEANRAKAEEHGIARVLLQEDREVANAFACPATPTAVIVAADGTIADRAAPGADAIHALVGATVPPVLRVIPPAPTAPPPATLEDLDGEQIDLTDPRAEGRLLLFWNPGCGFCSAMLDDLRAWEAAAPDTAPELILVSTGTPEENRAMGLRARIALDPGFTVAPIYGVSGTPSAVLLDTSGRATQPPAVGAPAVMALAFISHTRMAR